MKLLLGIIIVGVVVYAAHELGVDYSPVIDKAKDYYSTAKGWV